MVVKDQIKEGKSENEIYSFLTEKYGEWIVYKPKMNKFNFLSDPSLCNVAWWWFFNISNN